MTENWPERGCERVLSISTCHRQSKTFATDIYLYTCIYRKRTAWTVLTWRGWVIRQAKWSTTAVVHRPGLPTSRQGHGEGNVLDLPRSVCTSRSDCTATLRARPHSQSRRTESFYDLGWPSAGYFQRFCYQRQPSHRMNNTSTLATGSAHRWMPFQLWVSGQGFHLFTQPVFKWVKKRFRFQLAFGKPLFCWHSPDIRFDGIQLACPF